MKQQLMEGYPMILRNLRLSKLASSKHYIDHDNHL